MQHGLSHGLLYEQASGFLRSWFEFVLAWSSGTFEEVGDIYSLFLFWSTVTSRWVCVSSVGYSKSSSVSALNIRPQAQHSTFYSSVTTSLEAKQERWLKSRSYSSINQFPCSMLRNSRCFLYHTTGLKYFRRNSSLN